MELKPETERLVLEEIRSGHVQSLDELILQGVSALREKHRAQQPDASPDGARSSVFDLLTQPPFAGSELVIERQRDYPRPVDL